MSVELEELCELAIGCRAACSAKCCNLKEAGRPQTIYLRMRVWIACVCCLPQPLHPHPSQPTQCTYIAPWPCDTQERVTGVATL